MNNRPRAGRTLLSLIAKSRRSDTLDGGVEIAIVIDDNGVFAAHFGDDALDPDLAFPGTRGQFVDTQANIARSG